ncbi:DUF2948 family protein [Phaeovulum vinaykumarii]|uniref:DUF2948 family protein n=1 Tax=Phaeovulum vinaykumarii TaxID=407234 RepID=A0A1N7LAK2_9RHOB|nr:DUF2948 family protein [Phaeovulum vinaykumarii]SIS70895.1 Protein of unknown function [Phaeovulum vinaykumarii]SOB98661.1 hypothetical protein SAMN05878426_1028 [Phaeovulum vinaykumarii]
MTDARFQDGAPEALSLRAETPEDLPVIAALCQDAVLSQADMRFDRSGRHFALVMNRFRWEHQRPTRTPAPAPTPERVRTLLVISDVTGVASQGLDRTARDQILSILDLSWEAGPDGTGQILITLAGDGAIAVRAECLNVDLRDVSRPWPARATPHHPD